MAEERRAPSNERDIGRLQAEVVGLEKRLQESEERIEKRLDSIDAKVSQLVTAANMGQGAWWASVKIGGVIVTVSSALAGLIAWFLNK
jgi:tetrahydromethanopterin S-methyltransferase subunit G